MKPRTTLTLAAILVVVVGLAFLVQYSRRRSLAPSSDAIFPAVSAQKVDGIDIDSKTKPVKLRKQGTKWVVATEGWHEAEQKYPQQLLDNLDKFTTGTLISTAADKQGDFEVDSTGVRVHLLEGNKQVAEFIVGKPGPDFNSTYIRPAKEHNVYLIPAYLRSSIDRGTESWRRTLLVDVPKESISSFTMHNSKETATLEKDPDGSWKITAPFQAPARTDILGFALASLAQIRASGFADSTLTPEAEGLAPDTTSIILKTSDGTTHTIVIGKCNPSNQSYTRVDDDPTVYLVPRGRWNTIFHSAESLRAAEPKGAGGAPAPGTAPPVGGNAAPPARPMPKPAPAPAPK